MAIRRSRPGPQVLASATLLAGVALTEPGLTAGPGAAQDLVASSVAIVGGIKADEKYAKELRTAKGVILIPQAGAPGDAHALLVEHESDGRWTQPIFMTVGSIVSAAKAGTPGPAAMLLMTRQALEDFSRARFSVIATDGLTIVSHVSQRDQPLGEGDIELWSGASGAFDGVTLDGAVFSQDDRLDHSYYGRQASEKTILAGRIRRAGADRLRAALPR